MMEEYQPLHPEDIAEIRRAIRKIDGMRGDGVTNTRDNICIAMPRRQAYYQPQQRDLFDAKISAATAINGGIRWKYSIKIGHWDMTSSASSGGTWVDDSNDTAADAFNSAEDMNTFTSGTGAIGTGNTNVTQSDGTVNGGSCKLVPLPVGGYVTVRCRGLDSSATPYFTIIGMPNSAQ